MLGNNCLHQQITALTPACAGLAAPCQTHALTVVNACRNGYLEFLAHGFITCAVTVRTLFLDNLSGAITVRTCLHILHSPEKGLLGIHDFTLSITLGTGLRGGACLSACAVTAGAGFFKVDLDLFITAEYGFLKCNPNRSLYVGAP